MIVVRQAVSADTSHMQTTFAQMGWEKPVGYFAHLLEQQADGKVVVLMALQNDSYIGHCKIQWTSSYPHFKQNGVPEIQDLNVLPSHQRQGAAGLLLDEAERRIAQRSNVVGIGFGLYADYGAAQRIYIKRGYIPDGNGIAYLERPVAKGSEVRLDDNLVLYLSKTLS